MSRQQDKIEKNPPKRHDDAKRFNFNGGVVMTPSEEREARAPGSDRSR
jgi:hypothetical protein